MISSILLLYISYSIIPLLSSIINKTNCHIYYIYTIQFIIVFNFFSYYGSGVENVFTYFNILILNTNNISNSSNVQFWLIFIFPVVLCFIHIIFYILISSIFYRKYNSKRNQIVSLINIDILQFHIPILFQSCNYLSLKTTIINPQYIKICSFITTFIITIIYPIILYLFLYRNRNNINVIQCLKISGYFELNFPKLYKSFSEKYNILFSIVSIECWYWKMYNIYFYIYYRVEIITINLLVINNYIFEDKEFRYGFDLIILSIFVTSSIYFKCYYNMNKKEYIQKKYKFSEEYAYALYNCSISFRDIEETNFISKWIKRQKENEYNINYLVYLYIIIV